MTLADRYTQGVLAGFIAGVIAEIFDLIISFFELSTLRWYDYSSFVIYGAAPKGLWEQLFATLAILLFHAQLGVFFIYLLERFFTSSNLYFKGWSFGVAIWYGINAILHLFNIPEFRDLPLRTALTNFIGASIWGLSMVMALNWLKAKVKDKAPIS